MARIVLTMQKDREDNEYGRYYFRGLNRNDFDLSELIDGEDDPLLALIMSQDVDDGALEEYERKSAEGRNKMYITKTQIKKEIREELNCNVRFINHINKCGIIDRIKQAILEDDDRTRLDIMDEVYDEYRTFPYKDNNQNESEEA